jgi:4-hydroxy-3-methylbut-2-enyl diphosphate reductase
MRQRFGAALDDRFRPFDTICGATEDRQQAVQALLDQAPDLMVVVGGFNSSNTCNLAKIASVRCPTYHIEEAADLIDRRRIRHRPPGGHETVAVIDPAWLPATPLTIGLTAGASTPGVKIGEVIHRLAKLAAAG